MQKLAFRIVKGQLLPPERRPFGAQKAAFCNAVRNMLKANGLPPVPETVALCAPAVA
jgi:hypothetical protein